MEESRQEMQEATKGSAPAVQHITQGRGYGKDLDQGDYEIPRAKIVTFTSIETKDPDESKRIPAGRFINSVSKAELEKEFIPIYCYKTYVCWNAMDKKDPNFNKDFEPGARIFSTPDRTDPRVVAGINFGPNGEKPPVTKVLNYLCRFSGQRFPLILSFKSTSYKGAKKLNYMLEEAGGDIYSNKYKLVIGLETKNKNSYYVMSVEPCGKSTEEEFENCQAIYDKFYTQDIEAMAAADDSAAVDAAPSDDQTTATDTGWE